MSVRSSLGTFFKRGLRALLPTVLTIGVLVIVLNFFSDNMVGPVNDGIETFLMKTRTGRSVLDSIFAIDVHAETYRIVEGQDKRWRSGEENIDYEEIRRDLDKVYPPIIGFFVALFLVFVAGFVLATFVGRRILGRFEAAMGKFPVVKIIYPYARQVVEFFMREKTVKFNSVVAIEYPRKGIWSIGFVTGIGMRRMNELSGRTLVNVFIPSSPTPVTGYVIFVPVEETVPLPLTVDQAIRFAISGGVLIPEDQRNAEEILERFRQIEPPSMGHTPGTAPAPPDQAPPSSSS